MRRGNWETRRRGDAETGRRGMVAEIAHNYLFNSAGDFVIVRVFSWILSLLISLKAIHELTRTGH